MKEPRVGLGAHRGKHRAHLRRVVTVAHRLVFFQSMLPSDGASHCVCKVSAVFLE